QRAREPAHEHFARGSPDALVRFGEAVMPALVVAIEALEGFVFGRKVLDVHAAADLAPEVEVAQALLRAQRPPAESLIPADRLVDERGQDVEEVLVGDRESAVQLVQPAQGAPAALAVVAVLHELANDNVRVVVAFLGAVLELPGAVEQLRD